MDNRKINRLRRWAREGVILVLLTLAVAWGVDQYRKPTLPAAADLRLGDLVQHLPLHHACG